MRLKDALHNRRLPPVPPKRVRDPEDRSQPRNNAGKTKYLDLNKPLPLSPEEQAEAQEALHQDIVNLLTVRTSNTSLIEPSRETPSTDDLSEGRTSPEPVSYQEDGEHSRGKNDENHDTSRLTVLCDLVDNESTSTQSEGGSRVTVTELQEALMKANPTLWELHLRALNPEVPGTEEYYTTLTIAPNTPVSWTPESWLDQYKWELNICSHITGLILERYKPQGAKDHEVFDPISTQGKHWPRVHQAFWRVWAFCLTFGCNKGREWDIQKQQQWLAGSACDTEMIGATIDPSDTPTEHWTLLPEGFGYGNHMGLSVCEVEDMQILWKFLEDILREHVGAPPPDWKWEPEYQCMAPHPRISCPLLTYYDYR
ncbi:hypothetical protein N7522_006315 [Penicillium canescens]|nr:hypothetical protein N7522_006315 [Penicillium canescens]